MIKEVHESALCASGFGYIGMGILGFITGNLYLGFLIGLVAIGFIYLAALAAGLLLKKLEKSFSASIYFWLLIYLLLASVLAPVVQILMFGNNPFYIESWDYQLIISYVPIGLSAAVGGWLRGVYVPHNKSNQSERF